MARRGIGISKFGIQHFFDRHTQNQKAKSNTINISPSESNQSKNNNNNNNNPLPKPNPNPPQSLPNDVIDISPEVTKSRPFAFSPGMLIKQSQDDGVDEVTWRISPVNDRLQAVVSKRCSKLGAGNNNKKPMTHDNDDSSFIRPCALNAKLAMASSADNKDRVPLKSVNARQNDMASQKTFVCSQQSPFRTPPSLSYRDDKFPNYFPSNGTPDQLHLGQHKKCADDPFLISGYILVLLDLQALLDLLDQVEDVISGEGPVSVDCEDQVEAVFDSKTYLSKSEADNGKKMQGVLIVKQNVVKQGTREMSFKVDPIVKQKVDPVVKQGTREMPCKVDPVSKQKVDPAVERSILEVPPKVDPIVKQKFEPVVKQGIISSPANITETFPAHHFLVLEVSDQLRPNVSCGGERTCKVLRILNEQKGEEHSVFLWDMWIQSVVSPGDTVNIIGKFNEEGQCDVDENNNFLIVHPDILLSGTRVASTYSCLRRSVLDERIKSSEHSLAALIGTLLHQVFQAGLVKEVVTERFLEEYTRIVLQRNIESLYACGANENDIHKTLIDAVPKLCKWITTFRNPRGASTTVEFGPKGSSADIQKVNVSEVIDIEEMVWTQKYGLKGMIDASCRVKIETKGNKVVETIMPLEFKTGKAPHEQTSTEHTAQVILYTLLMSERYMKHIDSGLLYYLQPDQTQGILVQRSHLVGIIMRRNDLASDILKASTTQQLPQMLESPYMCRSCRHLDVCTIYHKTHGGSTESSGLGSMFDSHVNHLTNAHFIFLRHWDRLIDLEARDMQIVKQEIWHSHNLKTGDFRSGLSSLVLDASDKLPHQNSLKENRFIYRFVSQEFASHLLKTSNEVSQSSTTPNELDSTLKNGDYVMLFIEAGHQAIASGVITDISHSHVSVSFSKRLRLPGSKPSCEARDLLEKVWRIDKDEFVASFSTMRFNLVQMFLQSEQSSYLRRVIVDLEAPRFDSGSIFSQDPAISYVWSEKDLNDDQRRAILKTLTAKDYALILGMPGTGKTSTLVHTVKALLMKGSSVLLTSYTNTAVDNLLIKLKAQGIDFLRIGRHEAVHEDVREYCISEMNVHKVEDIKNRLNEVKVVAVTCSGITSPLLANKRFDVCIMDEAGQTTLPVSLGPLMFASMFVLVGDHYQLPPLVKSKEAQENGLGVSLFCRLSEAHPQAISALQSQYRMSRGIMELSNALIYGNRLRCGSPEVANATLRFSTTLSCSTWLSKVLNPSKPVIFVNTDTLPAYETSEQKTVNNPIEACIVVEVTENLVNNGINCEDIGIITPYNSQANLIRQSLTSLAVEIHTIDKYQGRDKDCILVSFVRSKENPRSYSSSLLGDWHRINVAITRAKDLYPYTLWLRAPRPVSRLHKKLIMVGSCKTLSKVPLLKLLIKKVEEQSGILSITKKDINHEPVLKRCSKVKMDK
ncbi:hypothetical protein ACFE04_019289 [Oxalis oulophora]